VNQWLQAHSQWTSTNVTTTTSTTDLFKTACRKLWSCTTVVSQNGPSGFVSRTTCKNCCCCHHSKTERFLFSSCLKVFFPDTAQARVHSMRGETVYTDSSSLNRVKGYPHDNFCLLPLKQKMLLSYSKFLFCCYILLAFTYWDLVPAVLVMVSSIT